VHSATRILLWPDKSNPNYNYLRLFNIITRLHEETAILEYKVRNNELGKPVTKLEEPSVKKGLLSDSKYRSRFNKTRFKNASIINHFNLPLI
jgi:hypothetical protein